MSKGHTLHVRVGDAELRKLDAVASMVLNPDGSPMTRSQAVRFLIGRSPFTLTHLVLGGEAGALPAKGD